MTKILLATALAAGAFPVAASAQQWTPAVRVDHADLDLATPQGVEKLDRRIARAIDRVCSAEARDDLPRTLRVDRCRAEKRAAVAPLRARLLARQGMMDPRVAGAR